MEKGTGIHVASAFKRQRIVPDLRADYLDTSQMIESRPFNSSFKK